MEGQPHYHLRPNKYVDRQIFVKVLRALNRIGDIREYTYVGMGSYVFDDFKLMHNVVGIEHMVSLEIDPIIYNRASFNKPLKCITLERQSSSAYIANLDPDSSRFIFWLDFTDPSKIGEQFNDFCRLISVLNEHNIIRITLNANPASLGTPNNGEASLWDYRLSKLRERLGEFVPPEVEAEEMIKKQYPLVLLSCLKRAFLDTVKDQEKLFIPLFSSIYDDNTQMLTLTGIVLRDRKDISPYKQNKDLKRYCNFSWDKPLKICMPDLTPKEIIHINNELPTKSSGKLIEKKYPFIFGNDTDSLKSYLNYYREYPNFHSVNF